MPRRAPLPRSRQRVMPPLRTQPASLPRRSPLRLLPPKQSQPQRKQNPQPRVPPAPLRRLLRARGCPWRRLAPVGPRVSLPSPLAPRGAKNDMACLLFAHAERAGEARENDVREASSGRRSNAIEIVRPRKSVLGECEQPERRHIGRLFVGIEPFSTPKPSLRAE